jgi:hypothetical protein
MGRGALATIIAAALVLAGCGEDEPESEPKPPSLPAELATALAVESDRIGESLAAGRECAAHRQAQALRAHVGDAVGSGDVPPELGREISAGATALADGISCEPTPPQPVEQPEPTDCEQIIDQLSGLRDLGEPPDEQLEPLLELFRVQCDGEDLPEGIEGLFPDGDGSGDGGPGDGFGGDGGPGNSENAPGHNRGDSDGD